MKADYWFKDKETSFAYVTNDQPKLFMAYSDPAAKKAKFGLWITSVRIT